MPVTRKVRRAVIPAAGRGERLDRSDTAKPLVPVHGVPLIVRVLSQLEQAGVEQTHVLTGHEAPLVQRTLTYHPALARPVEFAAADGWENGLATTLLAARKLVSEPFLLAMADHVFDDRLVAKLADVDIGEDEVVALVDTAIANVFDLDNAVKVALAGDRITAIGRKLAKYDAVDAGLFACSPAFFAKLERAVQTTDKADLFHAVALAAAAGKARVVFTDELPWDDVDTPAALVHTELRLRREQRVSVVKAATRPTAKSDRAKRYAFQTGEPATTELVVARGCATDPAALDLEIPPESASSKLFVFTDTTVNGLYGDRFVGALQAQGYPVHRIVMPDGEEAKTLAHFATLVERVLGEGIDERSILISLGGGAVCNVCGFVASTLYRGIGLIHVPTTLMAQCDAAISHKQALNGSRGKNLVGSYYAPLRVVVDVEFLATLGDRLIPDGLAEALKHAIGQDRDYYNWLLRYDGNPRDPEFLELVVKKNIELKCELMKIDPHEHKEGMVLQYGHNVGHAVEYLSSYSLTHGESVSIGMMVAARVAKLMGGADASLIDDHERLLAKFKLPTRIPRSIRIDDILEALRYDKKYLAEGVRMALVAKVGTLWGVDGEYAIPVSDDVLVQALQQTMEPV